MDGIELVETLASGGSTIMARLGVGRTAMTAFATKTRPSNQLKFLHR